MFDISELKNNTKEYLDILLNVSYSKDELKDTPIKDTKDIIAKGKITRLDNSLYHLELNIVGNIVLTCARSLEDVVYPIDIFIDKNIEDCEKVDEKQLFFQNSLDIFGIVWENIISEVPLRVVNENAEFTKEGNGWSLVEENERNVESPFSDLQKMLDMEGKR